MEEVIGTGGRLRWIAYRMTFSSGTTHLDVSARGDYDTGIFAYNCAVPIGGDAYKCHSA